MAMTLSSLETWQAISCLVTCRLKLMATSDASVQLMLALDIIGTKNLCLIQQAFLTVTGLFDNPNLSWQHFYEFRILHWK